MFEHLYHLDLNIDDFCCLITISTWTTLVVENIRQYSLIGPTQQNMKLFNENVLDSIFHFDCKMTSIRNRTRSVEKREKICQLIQLKLLTPSSFSFSSQHDPSTTIDNSNSSDSNNSTVSTNNNNNNGTISSIGNNTRW
jgi:hypothetical protein